MVVPAILRVLMEPLWSVHWLAGIWNMILTSLQCHCPSCETKCVWSGQWLCLTIYNYYYYSTLILIISSSCAVCLPDSGTISNPGSLQNWCSHPSSKLSSALKLQTGLRLQIEFKTVKRTFEAQNKVQKWGPHISVYINNLCEFNRYSWSLILMYNVL